MIIDNKDEKVNLGKRALQVSPPGSYCMGLSSEFGEATERQDVVQLIRRTYETGKSF